MLNQNTQKVVGALLDFNPSVICSYPIMGIRDQEKTIFAFIDLAKMGETEFQEFGLLKAKELLDLLKIAGEEATYTFDGRAINVDSKTVKCKYITTLVSSLEESCRTNPERTLNAVNSAETAMTFSFGVQQLSQIKSVSNLLNFEDLVLESSDEGIFITASNTREKDGNGFTLQLEGVSKLDTSILVSVSNLRKLPAGNYSVKVAKGQKSYSIMFTSESIEGLTVVMPTKATQKTI
jgi:hypothetical protein